MEKPYSEFSEYPEMTDDQKAIMMSAGLLLFGIQGVEMRLKTVLSYAFPERADMGLREMYEENGKPSKDTLGKLIYRLRKRTDVDDDFEALLQSFLCNRNRFVHGIMTERRYNPGTNEGVKNLRRIFEELESQCWHIDAVFMGYIVAFTQAIGIHDLIPASQSIYMKNLHKYFFPSMKRKWAEHIDGGNEK